MKWTTNKSAPRFMGTKIYEAPKMCTEIVLKAAERE
jgi:hypothetical protein